MVRSSNKRPPIAIGGVGGSGTRLIALIIKELGYFIGEDLNTAYDNLFFSLLFRRKNLLLDDKETVNRLIDLLLNSLSGEKKFSIQDIKLLTSLSQGDRHNFSGKWLQERLQIAVRSKARGKQDLIGWKEPNTHIILDRLLEHNESVKYIHVIRNGLDMALSKNQNQLLMWGDCFLNRPVKNTSLDSLKYWNLIHKRIIRLQHLNEDRILFLNYDKLCSKDNNQLNKLLAFIDTNPDHQMRTRIQGMISPPKTIGRHKLSNIMNELSQGDLKNYQSIMSKMEK